MSPSLSLSLMGGRGGPYCPPLSLGGVSPTWSPRGCGGAGVRSVITESFSRLGRSSRIEQGARRRTSLVMLPLQYAIVFDGGNLFLFFVLSS